MPVKYFGSAAAFRAWLRANHGKRTELWVGYYKKDSGRMSISYPESVDQALCFGWIDGVRKSVDAKRYIQRFSPRQAKSYWSAVNIRRATQLRKLGKMAKPGLDAFLARDRTRTDVYSFEKRRRGLSPKLARRMKANKKAWAFFSAQAPWYQRVTGFWVESGKREETRLRRLAQLIADSQAGRRIGILAVDKKATRATARRS